MILGTLDSWPAFVSREEHCAESTIEWTAFDASASVCAFGASTSRVASLEAPQRLLGVSPSPGYSLVEARTRSLFEAAQREIERYQRYPLNWDGYGAAPFDRELLDEFSELIRGAEELFLQQSIAPTLVTTGPASDGSLDFEIEAEGRRLLLTKYPGRSEATLNVSTQSQSHEYAVAFRAVDLAHWFSWVDSATVLRGNVVADSESSEP